MVRKFMGVSVLVAFCFLLSSCSKAPSDEVIKNAIKGLLLQQLPLSWGGSLMGSRNPNIELIEIKEKGKFHDKEKFLLVKARVKGSCEANMIFKWELHHFDNIGEFKIHQDDYGKWQAETDMFQDRQEATPMAKSSPGAQKQNQDTLPHFEITDSASGRKITSTEFKGKVLLLVFWASWAQPSLETPQFIEKVFRSKAPDDNFVVLTILHNDNSKSALAYLKSNGYTFPVYSSDGDGVSRIYGVTGVPETILIDKSGKIKKKYVGPISEADANILINEIKKLEHI